MNGTGKTTEVYLVTGGAGFIGSNFINYLVKKEKKSKIIVLDILNYAGNLLNLNNFLANMEILFINFGTDYAKQKMKFRKNGREIEKVLFGKKEKTFLSQKISSNNYTLIKNKKELKERIKKFISKKSQNILFIIMDIKNEKALSVIIPFCNYAVHFAAETHVDRSILSPLNFILTDILGTYTLLENIKATRKGNLKKIIHISTDEVYGPCERGKFNENTRFNPTSPYAASKASSDILALSFYKTYNLPIVIARPSNTYGPNQFPEKFIPLSIVRLLQGKKIPIYGDGNQKRDWIYVDDTVKGIYLLIKKGKCGESYNIGGVEEIKNIDVAKKICSILDKNYKKYIEFVKDRPSHDIRYFLENSKIRKLGWKPEVKFNEGIKKTIQWFINNRNIWQPLISGRETKNFFKKWEKR